MNISRANIEDFKWSVISNEVAFTTNYMTMREIIDFRRANMGITQMLWISKAPVIDCGNTLYNPKSLILLILN